MTEATRSGGVRRSRRALMTTTALRAAALLVLAVPAAPARAQPAPNARPMGGQVVVGQAAIARTATATAITQPANSPRTAVNWSSFDVGSQQSVIFQQPSPSAIVLNRVTGPDPSQIAGRITANGQIALVNQSGVVFYKGAQVDAAAVIVSAAGITDKTFQSGRMVFDQAPRPNARIENRGDITVKQAGLAALVAPRVANSGVITAKLGHVVLAGATAHTVDLYGDGLLSIDVTGQVRQAPVGPDGRKVAALVTNTGLIAADGGVITLTAQAADGLVQNLVSAGGRLRADTVGARAGRIEVAGIGGSVTVAGAVTAEGVAAGTHGGAIELNATRAVRVSGGATVSASGSGGGGTVAIGATLARAKGGPGVKSALTAKAAVVEAGARVTADATTKGAGGRVTVLSTDRTTLAGSISARGGGAAGGGGFVELSGGAGFALTGDVDVSAAAGHLGTILLDPTNLDIVAVSPRGTSVAAEFIGGTLPATAPDAGTLPSTIAAGRLAALGAESNVLVQATRQLDVQTSVAVANGLTFRAGTDLLVDRGVSINAGGPLNLAAGVAFDAGSGNGSILLGTSGAGGAVTLAAPSITLQQSGAPAVGNPGIGLADSVLGNGMGIAAATVDLSAAAGGVTQAASGSVLATSLQSSSGVGGGVSLTGLNRLAALGGFATRTGDFSLNANGNLAVAGALIANAGSVLVQATGQLDVQTSVAVANGLTFKAGTDLLVDRGVSINAGGPLSLAAGVAFPSDDASGNGSILLGSTGAGPAVTVAAPSITLQQSGRAAVGDPGIGLFDAVVGNGAGVSATTVDLSAAAGGVTQAAGGSVLATALLSSGGVSGGVSLTGGNQVATLGGFVTRTGDFSLDTSGDLTVGGALAASAGSVTLTVNAGSLTPGDLTNNGGIGALGATSNASLTAAHDIVESGGITAGNVASLVAAGGAITQHATTITAPVSVALSAGGGAIAQDKGATVSASNALGGVALIASAGIDFAGTIVTGASGSVNLTAKGGGLAENISSGSVRTARLSASAAGGAGVLLPATDNAINQANSLVAKTGDIVLVDSTPLTLSGATSADNIFARVLLRGGRLTIAPETTLTAGTSAASRISLVADSLLVQSGSASITASAGTVELAPSTPGIPVGLTVDTPLRAIRTGTLRIGAFVDAAAGALSIGPPTAGSISFDGPVNLKVPPIAGRLDLETSGAVVEPGGPLSVGTLSGTAYSATLNNAANAVDNLGPFNTTADFSLTNGQSLTAAGPVQAGLSANPAGGASSAPTLKLTVAGDLTVAQALIGGTVSLTTTANGAYTGTQTETTGAIDAFQLTGHSDDAAGLTNAGNAVATLAGFTAGSFQFADSISLALNGTVTGGSRATITDLGTLTVAGTVDSPALSLTGGSIVIPGTITDGGSGTVGLSANAGTIDETGTLVAGTLRLGSSDSITRSGGTFVVQTLTGNAGASADLGSGADVGALGDFTVTSGDFALANAQPLTLTGLLSAPNIRLSAIGRITLAGNIATRGASPIVQDGAAPAASGSYIIVQPNPAGASSIVQSGSGTLSGLDGGPATLRLQLPDSGGAMTFDDLEAPFANLVLGTGNGTAAGNIRAGTLFIVGAGGAATLRGSVSGDSGPGAAARAGISPVVDPAYTFNGCTIGATICAVTLSPPPPLAARPAFELQITSVLGGLVEYDLLPTGLPPPPPLPELVMIAVPSLAAPSRQLTDPDVVPPNISFLDY